MQLLYGYDFGKNHVIVLNGKTWNEGVIGISAAKIAAEGGKKFNKLETKCGLVDGEFNDADALKIIASLPSREVLIAKMLGSMLAPISKLAYVLNAIAEKQEAQA